MCLQIIQPLEHIQGIGEIASKLDKGREYLIILRNRDIYMDYLDHD